MERRFLLQQKRELERLVDAYILMKDLLESKAMLYRELALALRLKIKATTEEIVRRFMVLQNKIEELNTWSRIAALKTIENSVLESKLTEIRNKYDREMSLEIMENLSKLAKIIIERE